MNNGAMIDRVGLMPNMPEPFEMRDWRQVAHDYDAFVFDFDAKGDFLPLIWWDKTHRNIKRDTFGMPSYVGHIRQKSGSDHEGINCMAAVLGATISGIDKSNQKGHNWVLMCENYYNTDNGEFLVLNTTNSKSGKSFWYELYTHLLFYSLLYYYPGTGDMDKITKDTSMRWYEACVKMKGAKDYPDFNHTAFSFEKMEPVDNGRWKEPDAAAAIAWIQYMAYVRWKDQRALEAADWGLMFLENSEKNPFYELLLPYGAYTAARMNAELGRNYDVKKLVNWCFNGDSAARPGWGIIAEKWGEYDCHGLCGSLTDWGQRWDSCFVNQTREDCSGYAFAANTFSLAASLVPLVRYDTRFAHDIGKWMLNAANNARLFYPDFHPVDRQTCWFWQGDPKHVIAYEGLRKKWDTKSPYATGDPIRYGWGAIDLGLYGSSHVGIFGGIIAHTNVKGILQLDLLKTDFYHEPAYPTYLYYNPFADKKTVNINVGPEYVDMYDAASHKLLKEKVKGVSEFEIEPDSAVVLVILPVEGKKVIDNGKLKVDGIIADHKV